MDADNNLKGTPKKKLMALEEDTACVTLGGSSQHNEKKPATLVENNLF